MKAFARCRWVLGFALAVLGGCAADSVSGNDVTAPDSSWDLGFEDPDADPFQDLNGQNDSDGDTAGNPDVVADVVSATCEPNPCLQAPQNTCSGDGLKLTVYQSPGDCFLNAGKVSCVYPADVVDCALQNSVCSAGKCVSGTGDPCSSNPCTTPPQPECGEDGVTLLTYSMPASCTNVAGQAQCQYTIVTSNCATSGKVCQGSACIQQTNPCDPNPCLAPPADSCSGDLLSLYPNPGKCTAVGGSHACDYTPTQVKCSLSEMACQNNQCVPVEQPKPGPDAVGEILITEFMAKSQAGTDQGEWIELYNATNSELDLYGCYLADAQSDNHKIALSTLLGPGKYAVLTRSGDSSVNHGITPNYVYSGFSLANDGDEISLKCNGLTIDSVVYVGTWVKQGVSIQLAPAFFDADDNDNFDNWCLGTSSFGTAALLGTPGAANAACSQVSNPCDPNPCTSPGAASCGDATTLLVPQATGVCTPSGDTYSCDYPLQTTNCASQGKVCSQGQCVTQGTSGTPTAAGQVIFSEFMAKAVAGSADKGEFVEFYNTTSAPLDLSACLLKDKAGSHTIASSVLVPATGYVLLAMNGDTAINYGLQPDYVYSGIQLNNDGETLKLECSGVVIDEVTFTTTWVTEGASFQLASSKLDSVSNDTKANWCTSTAPYGTAGKFGTPGSPNGSCQ